MPLNVIETRENIGPPESMREHVVAASKQMSKGNWRECAEFILAVKVRIMRCISKSNIKQTNDLRMFSPNKGMELVRSSRGCQEDVKKVRMIC